MGCTRCQDTVNDYMDDEYRAHVVGVALKHRKRASPGLRELAPNVLNRSAHIRGFRSVDKARVELLSPQVVAAGPKGDDSPQEAAAAMPEEVPPVDKAALREAVQFDLTEVRRVWEQVVQEVDRLTRAVVWRATT